MLERLYVDNYRCLVNFECRFGQSQLLLGPNGAGKSTVFDAICLIRDFCASGNGGEAIFTEQSRTRWQSVKEQSFELDVSGNGGIYTLRLVVDRWGKPERPRVVKEELYYSGRPIFRFTFGEVHLFNDNHDEKVKYPFDWHRSALATITNRPENTKLSWFKQWLANVLYLAPDPHQMLTAGLAASESRVPARNFSNFGAWYRHLRLESDDQSLLNDLRQVIPGFESMHLKDAGLGNRVLMLSFGAENESDTRVQPYFQFFDEISDGQRVLVALYTVLRAVLNPDTTLLFDEPDNFVALKEITPWLEALLEKTEEQSNAQVLLVSHHPEMMNRLAFGGGLHFKRPGGRHVRVESFSDPSETGLSPSELVTRGWNNE